jgi:hypothetical protein
MSGQERKLNPVLPAHMQIGRLKNCSSSAATDCPVKHLFTPGQAMRLRVHLHPELGLKGFQRAVLPCPALPGVTRISGAGR